MSMWAAIVSIVAIVFGADTIAKISKNRAQKKASGDKELEEALAQVQRLAEALRARDAAGADDRYPEIGKLLI